jgi:carboxylesterase
LEDPVPIAPEDEPYVAPADPDLTGGRRIGVLLSHGFTGSPASMRPWAEHLNKAGYAVSVPLLPGHCTQWQELNSFTFADWYAEAERAFEKLQSECDQVFVAGLSMGGFIGLKLAVDKGRDVAGLVLVNPIINSERKDVKLLPVLKHVVPGFPAIGNDIKKPGMDERAYSKTPLKALATLFTEFKTVRPRLAEVTQPLLVFRSREDHVVDPSSGRIIMSTVSSRDLEERVLDESYHVATLDNDAETIYADSVEFFRRVSSA